MIEIDQLIRTNRRSIAIIIQPDGILLVRAPLHTPFDEIQRLVISKERWIRSKQAEAARRQALTPRLQFEDGAWFPYLGSQYRLSIITDSLVPLSFSHGFFLDSSHLQSARDLFNKWYRQQARTVITGRVHDFSAKHGFHPGRIRITSPRTRWGSCGARGSLNFNWRLVMAPLPIMDYVILHELVHLHHRNHSSTFWSAVERLMPDYRLHRKWLKEHGHILSVII